ncbi:MAG: hypothetical protein J5860_01155, partial [Clostridia bacterium]|nr:hypothetical protein [Clostridia bacterium]
MSSENVISILLPATAFAAPFFARNARVRLYVLFLSARKKKYEKERCGRLLCVGSGVVVAQNPTCSQVRTR